MKRRAVVLIAVCALLMSTAGSTRTASTWKRNKALHDGRARRAGACSDFDLGDAQFEPCAAAVCSEETPVANTQSEMAIAVDATGQHVVVGFNDFRGFALNPLSISASCRPTMVGALVPRRRAASRRPGNDSIGTTQSPQVSGDPDIKYLGGCTFIYSSNHYDKVPQRRRPVAQSRRWASSASTDCGHTWEGPFEITAATNPNGQVNTTGNPRDSADKEFIDVDPETGRVIIGWSNFTTIANSGGSPQNMVATFDNVATATPPTWSGGK